MRLAPGLCQPITPSLFCACVREWAVCSGLTDCFSVVGTLITAPTLSQASASLPPSFSSSCHALQSAPSVPRTGPTWRERERKDWKTRKETRYQIRGKANILEHLEQTSQLELPAPGGKADLRSGSESAIFGQRSVCGHSSTPFPARAFTPGTPERESAFTVMYCTAQCAAAREGGRSGLKERESLCEGEGREAEREA